MADEEVPSTVEEPIEAEEADETNDDEATGKTGAETEETEAEAPAPVEAEAEDPVAERLRAIEIENSFLRGQLASGTKQARKPEIAEDVDDEDDLPSEAEIDTAIRSQSAAKNLRGLFGRVVETAVKKALKKTGSQIEQSSAATAAERGDEAKAVELFPDVDSNKQFREVRDGIVKALRMRNAQSESERQSGGRYMRGDIVTATAAAYGECVRQGIIKVNGHAREEVRREIRKPGLASAKPGIDGKKDPLADFGPKERATILKNCKEFKVTPEEWVKSFKESEGDRA